MSIRSLYPDDKPVLSLDFRNSKRLPSLVTFTRSSTGSYIDNLGILRTAAINQPRFDHSPTSIGKCLGLLVEEARSNLLLWSEDFSTTWLNSATSETTNVATAPNGAATADKLNEDATTASHYILQLFTPTNATTYTASVFLKAAERVFAFVGFNTGSLATTFVSINLSTGVLTNAVGTPISSTVQSFGDGWYRVSLTLASTGTAQSSVDIRLSTDGIWANRSYQGTTGSGIYIWGAQLEAGAFPTSYIPTTDTTATRSADVCSISNANFLKWFSPSYTDHTFYCQALPLNAIANAIWIEGFESINFKGMSIALSSGDGTRIRAIQRHGASRADSSAFLPAWNSTIFNKAAVATSSSSSSVAGNAIVTSVGDDTPQVDWTGASGLQIGSRADSTLFFNGLISNVRFWPQKYSDLILQNITKL